MKQNSTFGFARPEDSPGLLLWQTSISWQREIIKALEPYKVTHPQFVILAILLWCSEKKIKPTQIYLAKLSKLDKMTISKCLKSLTSKKLVTRNENKNDTRAKITSLTSSGKKLAKKLIPTIEKIDDQYFSKLSRQDLRILINLFNNLAF